MRSPPRPGPWGTSVPSYLSPGPASGMGTWMTQPVSGKVPTPNSTAWTVPRTLSQPAAKSPAQLGPAHEQTNTRDRLAQRPQPETLPQPF